ncbi:MAG: ABC transporter ATP-binding protein [Bacteroidia bacterium]|nr:ABC transporter ATP-binding protein [Bacteroidia bacterium]
MSSDNNILFTNVNFTFDHKQIITGFSEVIDSGEHICIVGESGSGKSTLLNSVVGLTFPESGEIKIADLDVNSANIKQIRSRVTWLPQNVNLPYNSVLEMLKVPYSFTVNKHLQFDKEKCVALFQQTGLDASLLDKELSTLSGGEKQRVSLVSALMLERKILLLDEPTSALDIANRDKLIDLLNSLTDTTILAITHDEAFAESMNRVITLKKQ